MNYVLNLKGYPMLNISYRKRKSYYNALERSQIKHDDQYFLHWFLSKPELENEIRIELFGQLVMGVEIVISITS